MRDDETDLVDMADDRERRACRSGPGDAHSRRLPIASLDNLREAVTQRRRQTAAAVALLTRRARGWSAGRWRSSGRGHGGGHYLRRPRSAYIFEDDHNRNFVIPVPHSHVYRAWIMWGVLSTQAR